MAALKNLRGPGAGPGTEARKEERLIRQFRTGEWSGAGDLPGCSPTEQVTVALALGRYDLLPAGYADPLASYHQVLDDRQRAVVDLHRGW